MLLVLAIMKFSHAPNHKNKIEIVEMDDFPKPPPKIRIKYKDTYIEPSMGTNIRRGFRSENISVTWKNNVEATVVIHVEGHEPIITEIEFE